MQKKVGYVTLSGMKENTPKLSFGGLRTPQTLSIRNGVSKQVRKILDYLGLTVSEASLVTGIGLWKMTRMVSFHSVVTFCQALGISLDSLRPGAPVTIHAGPGDLFWSGGYKRTQRIPVHRLYKSRVARLRKGKWVL